MIGHPLAVALLLLQSSSGVTPPSQPVAIVSAVKGSAWLRPQTGARQPLTLYDWITSGAVVDVAPEARVELIMIDGRHYRLGGGVRAKLSTTSVAALRGAVTEEPALPELVSLAPIAGSAPRVAGAVRLRSRSIAKLYPCASVLTLRDETVLRFDPVAGATHYEIDVRTTNDAEVFVRTVERPPVAIPAGVLAAGTRYVWTVQAQDAVPPAKAEGRFSTLDSGAETARRAFASTLNPGTGGLLGGIDFHLGLLNEAATALTAAAQRAPEDISAQGAANRANAALAAACR